MMTTIPTLPELYEDFFLFLTTLRQRFDDPQMTPEFVRQKIRGLLTQQDVQSQASPALYQLHQRGKYLIVGTADALIVNSHWPHAPNWSLLEEEIYGSALSGDYFFAYLDDPGYQDPQLMEVFYLCLALGMEGRYQGDPDGLRDKRRQVHMRLLNLPPRDADRITPEAYAHNIERPARRLPVVRRLRLLILVLVIIGFFVFGARVIQDQGVEDIRKLAYEVEQLHEADFRKMKGN